MENTSLGLQSSQEIITYKRRRDKQRPTTDRLAELDALAPDSLEQSLNINELNLPIAVRKGLSNHAIPSSYYEAIKDARWLKAMNEEIEALNRNGTWELIDPPKGKNLVGSKWVYAIKSDITYAVNVVSQYMHAPKTVYMKAVDRILRYLCHCPHSVSIRSSEGCLGALDRTYINVNAPACDKPRYRTRKGEVATNVLGVCTPNMQFNYVLSGWEGSAADGRVLRDAINRRNGLKIPQGCYYLCDAGYTNGEGFLAPYRGQRYHLTEWRQGYQPTTSKEYFNMKHSQARNCIERCFGILKARWAILRDKSFYDVKTQCRIISACCILHNFIRYEMTIDPIESELDVLESNESDDDADNDGVDLIRHCETSPAWTEWRDKLADDMFTSWQASIN
ncbi:uncharacterized protein LOC141812482 [Curcuma longa]|uniref:uncharacterized protein LOC141812482 n=1 Tax=Curcuma longa TaxID=136217 RepID=UPI003D9FA324